MGSLQRLVQSCTRHHVVCNAIKRDTPRNLVLQSLTNFPSIVRWIKSDSSKNSSHSDDKNKNPHEPHEWHPEYKPMDPHKTGTGFGDPILTPGVKLHGSRPKTVEDFANPDDDKNWVSYGFDPIFKEEDRFMAHYSSFILITCVFGGVAFIFAYYPDFKLTNWATREAYLELDRRKKQFLQENGPLKPGQNIIYITKDYVDPNKITLPSEEELEGFEIII